MNEIIRNIPDWLIPVLLLNVSIVALAVIIDRVLLLLFRIKEISLKDERRLLDLARNRNFEEALDLCRSRGATHPGFSVASTLIESAKLGLNIKASVESEAHRTIKTLKRFLPTLGTISTIAPLMGLLGTVTGMIKSFHAFDDSKVQNAQLVGGIDEALITTTLGLIVAIPALIAYDYLVHRANMIAEETFLLSDLIVDELENPPASDVRLPAEVQNA